MQSLQVRVDPAMRKKEEEISGVRAQLKVFPTNDQENVKTDDL